MNPGRRNLSVVKVSASYDTWRLKTCRKTEKKIFGNFRVETSVFREFGMVFEELQPNGGFHPNDWSHWDEHWDDHPKGWRLVAPLG